MPVIVPKDLPAGKILKQENIFIMNYLRATTQDIRPLKIGILNLMPKKIETEIQFLRLLSNSPLQIDISLIRTASHESKNTSIEYLEKFYKTFDEIKDEKFDGMIVTGAPVELIPYEDVNYWKELEGILDYIRKNVHSTIFICWASQAALYYYYGIEKHESRKKIFGVYDFEVLEDSLLTKGFDDVFKMPQSRHTYIKEKDVRKIDDLKIIASRPDTGINLATTHDNRLIFIAGHGEYDKYTLFDEYNRDLNRGLDIQKPINYFKNDNVEEGIIVNWRSYSNLLFANWLNYCVYQDTPYEIHDILEKVI
ncbi:MAG: homoserine O-succinyltransferase [Tissierellaceae bacterium]|nr:homoserine O-succinyltransferase [Tissierellaceae bacterium]